MSTVLKNIKEEILDDDNIDDQGLEGKIVDYQFLVKPKQEQIDTKPNPASLELVGEIIDAHDNESKAINTDVSCKASQSRVTRRTTKPSKKTAVYLCKYCDYKTSKKEYFLKHTSIHELSREQYPYGCPYCEYKTVHKPYITKHINAKHTQRERIFICKICGHGSTCLSNYNNHIKTTHNVERKFDCDLCSYKAISKAKLNTHKSYVHFKKLRDYCNVVCDICGNTFPGKTKLNIHLLHVHKIDVGVQTYICYTCGLKYIQRNSFIKHVQQHSKHKEKMFCANCDYSTFIKTNLTQHMVKHDKHVKMHKCKLCSFETKRPHTLRHHVKTHFKD